MIDHVIKVVIFNIQQVIQIPGSRIESFDSFRLERDSMESLS